MTNPCVILNPTAGSVRDADAVCGKIRQRFPDAQLHVTAKRGAAERFARAANRADCELIVAAGGDGTLNEIVNGIAESKTARIAVLPLGTGNDFARVLGLPNDLDEALEIARGQHTRDVDLVRVTSDGVRYFVNVSAGGFSGVVDEKLTPEMKQAWGPLAYLRTAAAALPELRAYRTNIALDNDECVSLNIYNIVIANGRFVAGGIPIAPDAEIDDGLLDVVLIPETSAAQLAMLVPQLLLGTHLQNDAGVFRRAKKVSVNSRPGIWFNVDGEMVGNEPATFDVLPRALRFVVP